MRIGIDSREFKKSTYTGLRTILSDLVLGLAGREDVELVFFCDKDTDLESLPVNGKKIVLKGSSVLYRDQVLLPAAIRSSKVEVFFSPYIKTPLWRVCPYVNTVADIIPFVMPKKKGLAGLAERAHFFLWGYICSRRSVKVVTLSEDAGKKAAGFFGLDRGKIQVAYPSVRVPQDSGEDQESMTELVARYGLDEPYMLYVGNFKPHKNLNNLLLAYSLLPDNIKDEYRLLMVGGSGSEVRSMADLVEKQDLVGKVVPVGNIPHSDIFTFMRRSSVFVFPSIQEGFGIPPLEAMAMGVPVASSRVDPMTEVLAGAAEYFDPHDPGDMAKVLSKLLTDAELRRACVEKGKKMVPFFSPMTMTESVMKALVDAGSVKTLLISSEFPPVTGGMATHLFNLWKRFPEKRTVILTSRYKSSSNYRGDGDLDVVRESYPTGSGSTARTVRTIAVVWHVWRQNCVRRISRNHCGQVISAGLAGLVVKRLKGTPYSVHVYSADILEFSKNKLTRIVMRNVIKESEWVIANSDFTKSVLLDAGLADPKKVVVSTPGVDVETFSPEKGDGGVRAKHGISGTSKVILSVSRLVPRKGHDAVIKSMRGIKDDFPHLVYLIAGEGSERPRLEKLAKEAGLSDRVIFAGKVPDPELVHYYNACDIFILLPRFIPQNGDAEGFGIVFLEAGACGKPVIAGRSGGVAEAVKDNETGMLVDPEDTARIREAIKRLITDEAYAERLGKNAIKAA
ncbi:MAG: glycosyltransferase, partial [Candidatus Omnitrophica bacterium]|nr:glycosyltransferase [Candidatus Omnitrophota bacterium]